MDVLINGKTAKQRLFAHEASRWVGTSEIGGNNRGQIVEMFQKAVDGKAQGEPWCLAFVQFCAHQVDKTVDAFLGTCNPPHALYPSEHCLTLWNKTPENRRRIYPAPGTVAIWNLKETSAGHAGIVTGVEKSQAFYSVEGNTSGGLGLEREGQGVFEKRRSPEGFGNYVLLGFVTPWE